MQVFFVIEQKMHHYEGDADRDMGSLVGIEIKEIRERQWRGEQR